MNESIATAEQSLYDFFEFRITIAAPEKDIFADARRGILDTSGKHYAVVWHEYVHYLQHVTTTIGVRVFLNFVERLTYLSSDAAGQDPLLVPMRLVANNNFPIHFGDLLDQIKGLMGASKPLDASPPKDVQPFTPYLDAKDGTHAYLCIEDAGKRVGVPLQGNVFVENMAKGVQWLIERDGQWDGGLLAGRPLSSPGLYYDAIIRYFAHHAPGQNPCVSAILVSHAALQTTQPAAFFLLAHKNGMAEAVAKASTADFAATIRRHSHVQKGIASTLAALDGFRDMNAGKAGDWFYDSVLELSGIMRRALKDYANDEASFAELIRPSPDGIVSLSKRYHFPPLYTEGKDAAWTANLSPGLKELFPVMWALTRLAYSVHDTNMQDVECPLLRTRYCTFRKNKSEYCHLNRLNFQEVDGAVCVMGQAARLLGIYGKTLQPV